MNESPNRDEDDPLFEETSSNEVGTWLQENLRVIVSVFIVGAIALGIYSYSQRTETVSTDDVDSEISETTTDSTASSFQCSCWQRTRRRTGGLRKYCSPTAATSRQ